MWSQRDITGKVFKIFTEGQLYNLKSNFSWLSILQKNQRNFSHFLIARSIQLQSWGFQPELWKLLYLLDMSSKVYKISFWDKIDEITWIFIEILITWNWKLPKLKVPKIESCQSWKWFLHFFSKLPSCHIAKLPNCQVTKLPVASC